MTETGLEVLWVACFIVFLVVLAGVLLGGVIEVELEVASSVFVCRGLCDGTHDLCGANGCRLLPGCVQMWCVPRQT